MPTFDALQSATIAAVDRTFAERLGLYFLSAGKADAARGSLIATGLLRTGRGDGRPPEGRGMAWASRIAAGQAEAHIARDAYLGPPVRKGDKVRALDRTGAPFFEVAQVDDRGTGRIVLRLVEA